MATNFLFFFFFGSNITYSLLATNTIEEDTNFIKEFNNRSRGWSEERIKVLKQRYKIRLRSHGVKGRWEEYHKVMKELYWGKWKARVLWLFEATIMIFLENFHFSSTIRKKISFFKTKKLKIWFFRNFPIFKGCSCKI